MTEIFDIKQLDENRWQAKYRGNYGIYTVKLMLDENGETQNFSCNCPSGYHPCKHIGYMQAAVRDYIKTQASRQPTGSVSVSDILQNVSLNELRAFVIKKALYDKDLTKDIILEFAEKINKTKTVEDGNEDENEDENPYSSVICDALSEISVSPEQYNGYDYYDSDEYYVDLSILYEWFNKARDFESQEKFDDAISICKACIEEYAEWFVNQYDDEYDVENFISEDYMSNFFDLLVKIAGSGKIDKKSLYEYCRAEIEKEKYADLEIINKFNNLMARCATDVNLDEFIALQNALLKKIEDNTSYNAKQILERIIFAYKSANRPEKAEEIIENNLQLESFRRQAVEKRIEKKNYADAKRLINEALANSDHNYTTWKELLLSIAQKENDTAGIRKISKEFLAKRFNNKHFEIYKRTFRTEEWTQAFNELYGIYSKEKPSYYSDYNENLTELLHAENLPEQLMDYIESHLSTSVIEKYHGFFSEKYPEKTLTFFSKAVNEYAERNVGEKHYEYASELLKMMRKIRGGDTMVAEMIMQFKTQYKRRSLMMKILERT